jgi:hypothetical protein
MWVSFALLAAIQRHKPATRITAGLLLALLMLLFDEDVNGNSSMISWRCQPDGRWAETMLDRCGASLPAQDSIVLASRCHATVLRYQR